MKPLNEKLQKGVRAIAFALVATASIGSAIAMKPAALSVATYRYGVSDAGAQSWRVEAHITNLPQSEYECTDEGDNETCTVTFVSQNPLLKNALIPKSQAANQISGTFTMEN